MNLSKSEHLLLSIKNNTDKFIKQTKARPEESSDFGFNKSAEIFLHNTFET